MSESREECREKGRLKVTDTIPTPGFKPLKFTLECDDPSALYIEQAVALLIGAVDALGRDGEAKSDEIQSFITDINGIKKRVMDKIERIAPPETRRDKEARKHNDDA